MGCSWLVEVPADTVKFVDSSNATLLLAAVFAESREANLAADIVTDIVLERSLKKEGELKEIDGFEPKFEPKSKFPPEV